MASDNLHSFFDPGIPTFYFDHETGKIVFPPFVIPDFPWTRDDTSTTTPQNFIYTDEDGNVLSAPLDAVFTYGSGAIDYVARSAIAELVIYLRGLGIPIPGPLVEKVIPYFTH